MNASMSPLLLPVQTLRLLARNWGPLLVWFCVGHIAYDLLLRGGARLSEVSQEAGVVVLSVGVLVKLITLIVLFHAIRGDMPNLTRLVHIRTDSDPDTRSGEEQRVVEAIGRSILPFLILYGAWGLVAEDVRVYSNFGIQAGDISQFNDIGFLTALAIVAVSLLLRVAVGQAFHRTGKALLGILVAFFEAVWMFFAVFSVLEMTRSATSWVTSRTAWVEAAGVCVAAVRRIGATLDGIGLSAVPDIWLTLFGYLPALKDGLVLPLLWLTITAVVYGRDMQRAREIVSGHQRLERVGGAVDRVPDRTRGRAEFFAQGPRDKYVPVLNGLRLVLNAGPGLYLVFCVFYLGLDHAIRWAWIAVTRLIGPHDVAFWEVVLVPVTFGTETSYEVLRVALLAATFDLVLRRVSARTAEPTAAASAMPAPPAARPVPAPPGG